MRIRGYIVGLILCLLVLPLDYFHPVGYVIGNILFFALFYGGCFTMMWASEFWGKNK